MVVCCQGECSGGYIRGYASQNRVQQPDRVYSNNCCQHCKDQSVTNRAILGFYHRTDSDICYCHVGVFQIIHAPSDGFRRLLFFYRIPIELRFNTANIGDVVTAHMVYRVIRSGNDTNQIFAIDSLDAPLNRSGRIKVESPETWTLSWDTLQGKTSTHFQNKLNDSVELKYPDVNKEYVFEVFGFKYKVMDMDVADNSDVWITNVHTNNILLLIDMVAMTVTRPPKKCNLILTTSNSSVTNNFFLVNIGMETTDGCVADIKDLSITLQNDVALRAVSIWSNDSCVDPAETSITDEIVNVNFKVFIDTKVQIQVMYRGIGENVYVDGSKQVTVLADIYYTSFNEDVAKTESFHQIYTNYISKNMLKGFYVLQRSTGKCFKDGVDGFFKFSRKLCSRFKEIPYNILHESGQTVWADNGGRLRKKNDVKVLAWDQHDFKSLDNGKYASEYASGGRLSFGAVDKTYAYRRVYDNFGVLVSTTQGNKLKYEKENDFYINITVLQSNTEFIFCAYHQKRKKRECARYDTANKRVQKLPYQFSNIFAYDHSNATFYGEDAYRNMLVYNRINKIKLAIINNKYWNKIKEGNDTLVYSKWYSRKELALTYTGNEFSIDSKHYDVTYYGIYDNTDKFHIIIWPADVDCKNKVGATTATALISCRDIKRVCPSAKSGVYWIGGKDFNVKGRVYCDMETDEGGWMVIANYTITDGVSKEISVNYTTDIFDVYKEGKYFQSDYLSSLDTQIGFTQMRFYCYLDNPGRTIHLKTLEKRNGNPVISYMKQQTSSMPPACNLFEVYSDDTSIASTICEKWGYNGGSLNYWGHSSYRPNMIYQHMLGEVNKFDWRVGVVAKVACDNEVATSYRFGQWKVYVR